MWRSVLRNSRRIRRAYHVVFVGEEKKWCRDVSVCTKNFKALEDLGALQQVPSSSEQNHETEKAARGKFFWGAGLPCRAWDGAGCGEVCGRVACPTGHGGARGAGGLAVVLEEDSTEVRGWGGRRRVHGAGWEKGDIVACFARSWCSRR
jgi:hypothetical protein